MADLFGPGFGKRITKQYEQNGKQYVEFSDGRILPVDSDEYKRLYSEGLLYGEDETGKTYLQEFGVNPEIKRYQELTDNYTLEQSNYDSNFRGLTGKMNRANGITEQGYLRDNPEVRENYDSYMDKEYIKDFSTRNPKQDGEGRGEYLDRVLKDLPQDLSTFISNNLNGGNQTTYLQDFAVGAINTVGTQLGKSNESILNLYDKTGIYSEQEMQDKRDAYEDSSYSTGLSDRLGLLAPMNMIAKVGQSTYRKDYSLGQALRGEKNDAGIAEDILADTAMTLGAGALAKGLGGTVVKGYNAVAPEIKEVARTINHPTKTGKSLLRVAREGERLGLSEFEIAKNQMNQVGITSAQRENYVPGVSDFLEKYVTPQGYHGNVGLNDKTQTKLGQIINNVKKGGYDKYLTTDERVDAWKLYLGKPQTNETFGLADTVPLNHPSYNAEDLSKMDIYNINSEKVKNSLIRNATISRGTNEQVFRSLDNEVSHARDNYIMGGYNQRLSKDGLEYNDVWDLEPQLNVGHVIRSNRMKNNPLFEKLFYTKNADGSQVPRGMKIPVHNFVGKPFMSHGVLPFTSDDQVKVLRGVLESDINRVRERGLSEAEMLNHRTVREANVSLEKLKGYPKFQDGGMIGDFANLFKEKTPPVVGELDLKGIAGTIRKGDFMFNDRPIGNLVQFKNEDGSYELQNLEREVINNYREFGKPQEGNENIFNIYDANNAKDYTIHQDEGTDEFGNYLDLSDDNLFEGQSLKQRVYLPENFKEQQDLEKIYGETRYEPDLPLERRTAKDFEEGRSFMKDFVSSDNYLNMLKPYYDDPKAEQQSRLERTKNVKGMIMHADSMPEDVMGYTQAPGESTDGFYTNENFADYDNLEKTGYLTREQINSINAKGALSKQKDTIMEDDSKVYLSNMQTGDASVHEISHNIKTVPKSQYKDIFNRVTRTGHANEVINMGDGKTFKAVDYLSQPTEVISRLDRFRQLMRDENIKDQTKEGQETFNEQDLIKAFKNPKIKGEFNVKQLIESTNNSQDLLWLMNNIVNNDKNKTEEYKGFNFG